MVDDTTEPSRRPAGDGAPPAEVTIDVSLVAGLLADQHPDLADLSLRPVASGWDNAAFRLGDRLVVRLPRRALAASHVVHEAALVPRIAAAVPLAVPVPVRLGGPGRGYPWSWSICRWIPGSDALSEAVHPTGQAADTLAAFLAALWSLDPRGAPANPWRGGPLTGRDAITRERLARVSTRHREDPAVLAAVWEAATAAPPAVGPGVLIHGDLHPANLVVVDGRLVGVLDFGDLTVGDPATDLVVAWSL
ncbi:MAG: aminoglycoside phosphotransferase family protein, partial [Actinomyces sp.]